MNEVKQKAKELFKKFEYKVMSDFDGSAHKGKQKECALIVCDEIIKENLSLDDFTLETTKKLSERFEYWQSVKQEITKL